ncbi:hypothetical protein Pelo_16880 [Pelomyxa schiedti]|nr:hypothetical protein Pelo_16880 [Pelomyxa schiedti]
MDRYSKQSLLASPSKKPRVVSNVITSPVRSGRQHRSHNGGAAARARVDADAPVDFVSQFVALCTMGHPRCGRDTPLARVLPLWGGVSASSVARLVWEWVSACPTMHFSVHAFPATLAGGYCDPPPSSLFAFGVSPITHGLIQRPPFPRHWLSESSEELHCEVIGANQLVAIGRASVLHGEQYNIMRRRSAQSTFNDDDSCDAGVTRLQIRTDSSSVWGRVGFSGSNTVWSGELGTSGLCAVNHRWFVLWDSERGEAVVVNLLLEFNMVGISTAFPMQRENVVNVFMNQMCDDEAVLVSKLSPCILELTVFNVSDLWFGFMFNQVSVRFSLQSTVANTFSVEVVLVLQTKSKERAYVVMITEGSDCIVLHYYQCSGQPEVHKLSTSLYCVSCPSRLEIWDCNIPSHATTTVDHFGCCWTVTAHAGFLFHLRDDQIVVTDYCSGSRVIALPLPKQTTKYKVGHLFSFLL